MCTVRVHVLLSAHSIFRITFHFVYYLGTFNFKSVQRLAFQMLLLSFYIVELHWLLALLFVCLMAHLVLINLLQFQVRLTLAFQ